MTDKNGDPWFVAKDVCDILGLENSRKATADLDPDEKHGTKPDGTKFAFHPTVRITRKGLALLHKRIGETFLTMALETTND